jgi:hypothetical protein
VPRTTTIREERLALAETLKTLSDDLSVYPYWVEQWDEYSILIKPDGRSIMAMDGEIYRDYVLDIMVLAGELEDAQMRLDDLLEEDGELSIRELLDNDPTFGGRVGNSEYMGWQDYGARRSEGQNYVSAAARVRIYA